MRIVHSVRAMQTLAKRWRRGGVRIGFVPTMGSLHEGHLSLVRRARRAAGPTGRVVVSIYVNPTQFGPGEDLSKYPRDLRQDAGLCRSAAVDVLFAPRDTEMFPHGNEKGAGFSTWVVEEELSASMEGRSRPGHFRGVTTVVAKLFNIVLPDAAVFGAKDWQQAAVVRRMVRDLNFSLNLIVSPTRRESDGLAMSSRNAYLKGDLRQHAVIVSRTIAGARHVIRSSRRPVDAAGLKRALTRLVEQQPRTRVDYMEFFDPLTLIPVKRVTRKAHLALAVFVGKTRLIDNGPMS
jgi:pantoate--beta-alanine ligase